ncbi:MAG TPA: helix-turn-helix transcriptional regulator [Verrucomicrobiae bacterium]|jgi:transcriptional regulator with XRE-family HTH domain|nr:helix-turn-helix transcriptional regulator [Verrucomicrobiae bacterium]
MASSHLPNYLKTHRKRLGLTQDEIAYLLGVKSGSKVSRYESFSRVPNLETALAYKVIFGRPANELLAGIYHKIEKEVAARAKTLERKMSRSESDSQTARKREALADIAARTSKKIPKQP